jgi:tripartite-type tricarboxylate transporter receptor subunit TctC
LTTANAPPDQINRINAAISKALQDPELQKKLADQGSVPAPNSVADFKSFIQKETGKWAELVKISGAAVE